MVEKECGIIDHPTFPALWELSNDLKRKKLVIEKRRQQSVKQLISNTGTAIKLPVLAKTVQLQCTEEYSPTYVVWA